MAKSLPEKNGIETLSQVIIKGLLQNITKQFNIVPILTSSNDTWRLTQIRAQQNGQGNTIAYPICLVQLNSVSLNDQMYNARSMQISGTYGSSNADNSLAQNIKLLPAFFQLEISFLTDDFYKMLEIVDTWVPMSRDKGLFFSVTYFGVNLDIAVIPDDTLRIPVRDNLVDLVNMFQLNGQVNAQGYISGQINNVTTINTVTSSSSSTLDVSVAI